ncbi:MAG TPA: hypothetical protein VF610_04090, partial [Segetibacter sp.]
MNIALSAVIIFILLIPPIAFYVSYSFGKYPKAGPKFSFLDGVLASAVISLFVHALAISFIPGEIRFDILLKLFGGEIKDIEQKVSNRVFSNAIKQFAIYNLAILVLFITLGKVARWMVIHYNLNRPDNELLRLNNRWVYLFNGTETETENFDLLLIDAVVDTKDGTMIYSGFLVNYICNGEELDRIYLRNTVRREFKTADIGGHVANKAGEPVTIPGATFSIPYKIINNLNFRFLEIS